MTSAFHRQFSLSFTKTHRADLSSESLPFRLFRRFSGLAMPPGRPEPQVEVDRSEVIFAAFFADYRVAKAGGGVRKTIGGARSATNGVKMPTPWFRKATGGFRKPTDRLRKPTDRFRKPTDRFRKATGGFRKATDRFRKATGGFRKATDLARKATGQFRKAPAHVRKMPDQVGNATAQPGVRTPNHAKLRNPPRPGDRAFVLPPGRASPWTRGGKARLRTYKGQPLLHSGYELT